MTDTGSPAPVGTDLESFWAELRRELYAGWAPVAVVDELARSGDVRCRDLADISVIVVRADERLLVYRNSCPHQGFPILGRHTAGHVGTLVCPLHGWVFSLEGALRPIGVIGQAVAPPGPGGGPMDLGRLAGQISGGLVWSSPGSPATEPPRVSPPFRSGAPPARVSLPVHWKDLCERMQTSTSVPLGPNSFLVPIDGSNAEPVDGRAGRFLVTVVPQAPGGSQVVSWFDPDGGPTPLVAHREAYLRRIAGLGWAGG